jgi:hypothetical protein
LANFLVGLLFGYLVGDAVGYTSIISDRGRSPAYIGFIGRFGNLLYSSVKLVEGH